VEWSGQNQGTAIGGFGCAGVVAAADGDGSAGGGFVAWRPGSCGAELGH